MGSIGKTLALALALLWLPAILGAALPAHAREFLTVAEAEATIEEARREIGRLSDLRREDQEIKVQLLEQYRKLGRAALNLGARFKAPGDFRAWLTLAEQLAASEPADWSRRMDVMDALLAFADYEWTVRPNSENWFDYGQDALAVASRLRDTARDDERARHALGEKLNDFPPSGPARPIAARSSMMEHSQHWPPWPTTLATTRVPSLPMSRRYRAERSMQGRNTWTGR